MDKRTFIPNLSTQQSPSSSSSSSNLTNFAFRSKSFNVPPPLLSSANTMSLSSAANSLNQRPLIKLNVTNVNDFLASRQQQLQQLQQNKTNLTSNLINNTTQMSSSGPRV